MNEIDRLTDAVLSPIQVFWSEIVAFSPNLLAALILVVVGYALARVLRLLLQSVLARLGLDTFGEKAGVTEMLKNVNEQLTLSRLLGALAFWFVQLAFFISAADALQLPRFSAAIDEVVRYVPNVVGAIAILLVGLYVGRLTRDAVTVGVRSLGVEYAGTLANVTYLLIAIVTVSLAVNRLNIETDLLNQVVSIVLVGAVLAVALAIGLGGRAIAANVIAGIYLRELVEPKQRLRIGDADGQLLAVAAVKTVLESDAGEKLIIANQQVLDAVVVVRGGDAL